jgi:hypothetical protein
MRSAFVALRRDTTDAGVGGECQASSTSDDRQTDYRPPTTNRRLPTTSTDYRPPTSNQTDYRPPTSNQTDYQLPTTNHRLPTTDYRPPTTDHRLPTTDYRPPDTTAS